MRYRGKGELNLLTNEDFGDMTYSQTIFVVYIKGELVPPQRTQELPISFSTIQMQVFGDMTTEMLGVKEYLY